MARDCDTDNLVDSLEEFRSLVLAAFRRKLRVAEEEAAQAGRAVLGEFSVGTGQLPEPLLRIQYICEPGKPGRVIMVDGPKDCSALFPEDGPASRLQ